MRCNVWTLYDPVRSCPFFLYVLLSTQGSFPAQALPRVFGTTSLSASLTTQPSPADYRFGVCHTIARASRVATLLIFHACQRHYPGGNTSVPVSLTSPCILGLLPNCDGIDLRIKCFEACSVFTHVSGKSAKGTAPSAALRTQRETLASLGSHHPTIGLIPSFQCGNRSGYWIAILPCKHAARRKLRFNFLLKFPGSKITGK